MKKKSYENKTLKEFTDSFKLGMIHLKVILFDLLFYAITIPFFYAAGFFLAKQAEKMNLDLLNNQLLSRSAEEIQALSSQVQGLFFILIGAIVVVLAVIISAWSLSRGLVYTTLLKKRLTKDYFLKFAGLNLVLGVVFIAVVALFSRLSRTTPSMLYVFLALTLEIGRAHV